MTNPSNLYATSIFSEQPISVYPLDDNVKYISLISDDIRLFGSGGWSASADNSASVVFNDSPTLPLEASTFIGDDNYTQIEASGISVAGTNIEIESPGTFRFDSLNKDLATFSISFHLFQNSFFVNWYEVGYKYYNNALGQDVEVTTRVTGEEGRFWTNFDFSFLPTEYDSDRMRIFIRINVDPGGAEQDYRFIMNGLAVGQWSETSHTEFLGNKTVIDSLGYTSIPALEYGIQEQSGSYIVEDNKILAKNEGIPLVFGSTSCTRLYPSKDESLPSIIFPGKGFLHSSGKYNDYTVEFWMNIHPKTFLTKRIFGPIDTDDGIYINNAFISLKIGDNYSSHPVSEWYRPMICHLTISSGEATLIINGEQVASVSYIKDEFEFSSIKNWIGFFTYSDIDTFTIDCVSIYPYIVPIPVAKRRFALGQATESPQSVADAFEGKSAYVNYSNANYTANKIYPDTSNWDAGYSDNLNSTKSFISMPEYSLPNIYIGGRNVEDLYADNKIVNELQGDKFFTFRPNVDENNQFSLDGLKWTEPGYIYFDSLGIVDSLSSIYGVFSTTKVEQQSTLILITNSINSDKFHVHINNGTIYYDFNDETIYTETFATSSFDDGGYSFYPGYSDQDNYSWNSYSEYGYDNYYGYSYDYFGYYSYSRMLWEYSFAVGINIEKLLQSSEYRLKKFFSSINTLQVYFAGNKINTFEGKIHSIGLSNKKNSAEIEPYFLDNGVLDYTEYNIMSNHFATYTLSPLVRFNKFFMDISVSSSWEEYIPLSFFGGYVQNNDGETYYDLDFLQINIGYPTVNDAVEKVIKNLRWSYVDLEKDFSQSSLKPYYILDNPLISGYGTYEELKTKNEIERFLNTSQSSLRSFLTFQLLSEGANEPISNFPYFREITESRYIDADKEASLFDEKRPYLTRFEFVDKTVVFPPSYFDFNKVAIVFNFSIKHEGILSNPLIIRDFEIVSKALNHNRFNEVGAESGSPFYTYVKDGIYYENKAKNPVAISKKRSPYLYLTEDSGLSIRGNHTKEKEYGVAVPINEKENENYRVHAIQMFMKYDKTVIPQVAYPVFEVDSKDKTIEFIMKVDASGQRAMIAARDKKTRQLEPGVVFYQNGIRVRSPFIKYDEWNSIGITFDEELIFSGYAGYINFFRGFTVDNVCHFKSEGMGRTAETVKRRWRRVLSVDDIDNLTWASWYVEDGTKTKVRTNICYNPNIEESDYGWGPVEPGTIVSRSSDQSLFSNYSLKCITSSQNYSGATFATEQNIKMNVLPENEYTVSAYIYVPEESSDKNIKIVVKEYAGIDGGNAETNIFSDSIDGGSSLLSFEDSIDGGVSSPLLPLATSEGIETPIASGAGWLRVSHTVTLEQETTMLGIDIVQEGSNSAGEVFYIDAVLIEKTTNEFPKLRRYFDGTDSAGGNLFQSFGWDGAENNSTSTAVYFIPTEDEIRLWANVYVESEKIVFSVGSKDLFNAFTGNSGFVINDESSVVLDSDLIKIISDASLSRFEAIPA